MEDASEGGPEAPLCQRVLLSITISIRAMQAATACWRGRRERSQPPSGFVPSCLVPTVVPVVVVVTVVLAVAIAVVMALAMDRGCGYGCGCDGGCGGCGCCCGRGGCGCGHGVAVAVALLWLWPHQFDNAHSYNDAF